MNVTRHFAVLLGSLVLAVSLLTLGVAPARALSESQQDAAIASLQSTVASQQTTINALMAKLQYVSVSGTDMTISGANLHVVSGAGATNAKPNGLGNVIIGYDEARTGNGAVNTRTGSHNLILGTQNNYSSYAGIVAGVNNTVSSGYDTVTGGKNNTASGFYCTVSGGYGNTASGSYAAVGGGSGNAASGLYAFLPLDTDVASLNSRITALQSTTTTQGSSLSSLQTSVTGATAITNLFSLATDASRSDSKTNTELTLSGVNLHVVSGSGYTDDGTGGEVTGATLTGLGNLIIGYNELRGGHDVRTGSHNLIVGQAHNYTSFGGIVAGQHNEINGSFDTILGGYGNVASQFQSAILGGYGNTVSGNYTCVSGGDGNVANGDYSSVSGGGNNAASGNSSSVSGGYGNTTSADDSSVSGGYNLTLTNEDGWAAGSAGSTAYSGNFSSP